MLATILSGLHDGWSQPFELSTSANVKPEHQEMLDRTISIGQLIRAGRQSQTWREGLWPVRTIKNLCHAILDEEGE